MRNLKRVAVYCGSSQKCDPVYLECARQMGRALGERSIGVVYGGGRMGLMGEVADSALQAGGEVHGVIPDRLIAMREIGHVDVTELYVVDSMHARKSMMAHLSDAYIALPGGFGTWEEILEVTTLALLGYHKKPLGLLNFNGYYDHFVAFLAHAVESGFVRPEDRDLLHVAERPAELIEILQSVP